MIDEIADLDLVVTDTEMEALALENNFIKRHQPALQRPAARRQEPPVPQAHAGRGVPAAARGAAAWRRTATPTAGPTSRPSWAGARRAWCTRVFGIRSCKETLNGRRAAARACSTRSTAAWRRAWSRSARPSATAQAARTRALFLEGRTRRGGGRAAARRWRSRGRDERFEEAATPARPDPRAASGWRRRRRSPPPTSRSATCSAPTCEWRARRAAGVLGARRQGGGARGLPAGPGGGAGAVPRLRRSSSTTPRAATCRARSWWRTSCPDRELLRGVAHRSGAARSVRIRVPQRGEKVRLLELVLRNAQPRLRPRVAASAQAVAGDPARRCATCSTSRWSRGASSASTSRTSRASDIVASMVVFEDGAAQEVGLPEVPDPRRSAGSPTTSPPCARWWGGATSACSRRARSCPTSSSSTAARASWARRSRRWTSWGSVDQPVASLAKREELIFVPGRDGADRPAASLAGAAARAARARRGAPLRGRLSTARRARSAPSRSELDDIPGIGPAKRRQLLSRFGSVRGVRSASPAELAAAVGPAMAGRVRKHFGLS